MNLVNKFHRYTIVLILFLSFFFPARVFAQTGIEVIIHSVNAEPVEGEVAYTVKVYFSVLDGNGLPIYDLTVADFALTEDSQNKEIESIEPVFGEAINLVLVMDTSGSMLGQGIIDARNAASTFLQRLGNNDQSAVITFNDEIRTLVSFTNNHQASGDAVGQISAVNMAGTCLYDAAYQALELAATAPPGRRAVILFTDGKDETAQGSQCSFHEVSDVLDLAESSGTPIYTLGLGSTIDTNELKRIASTSGGSFLSSRDSSELDAMFSQLYDQLNNEYVLTYQSSGAPGPHSLVVEVNSRYGTDQSSSSFNLPALPTTIVFNAPAEGETLEQKTLIKAKLLTQGAEVASVEFAAGGVIIGKDISEPYEFEWDITDQSPGEIILEVVAIGKDGAELARAAVNVYIPEIVGATDDADAGADPDTADEAEPAADEEPIEEKNNLPIYLAVGGFVLVGGSILVILLSRKKKENAPAAAEEFKLKQTKSGDDVTYDGMDLSGAGGYLSGGDPLAILTVQNSDDPASIGHQYQITHLPIILGRSVEDAGIVFSNKDQAISRKHAMLDLRGNEIVLSDMVSKYGTFLNDHPVGGTPTAVKTGDVIRLGKRTKLKFDQVKPILGKEDETFDGMEFADGLDENTRDPS